MRPLATDASPQCEPADVAAMRGLARAIVATVVADMYLHGGRHRDEAMLWLFDEKRRDLVAWREQLCELADIDLHQLRRVVQIATKAQLVDLARWMSAG